MNKYNKKKISHAIGLLEHAAGSVKAVLASGLQESALSLLTNLQQMTIEIGNILEEKETDCGLVIHKLEALCEIYYQCSIISNDSKEIARQCTIMKKYIADVKSDIQKIPVKAEILFLPYQVSMWDSLESVWRAAQGDRRTDCYVVPLPVYDVMPDNSLGELHYDGALYPDDVPVTHYLEYDIQNRHPDIIFFHNPYDDANTVTRVPELYYSRNLKKYTDLLVYIPYYMTGDRGPVEYQCYTPGILFADYVVVQKGIVYENFCRIYTDFLKQNGWEQVLTKAEDKFLPLGSPKKDKLLQTKCSLSELPEQWRNVIRKADGSSKKIVFYNISITSLLENNEKMLKKIDEVLEQFRTRQNEVALLWRPHPLLKKTIIAMRPQLKDAYEERIQQYQKEGWGIYDETPDSNLAMILSDAYYGDYSSLIVAYQALNKPVLLQNTDSSSFQEDNDKIQLWFNRQPVMIDGELWFTQQDRNGLYRFSLNKSESVFESMFANEPVLQEALYGDIVQYGDLLIFPPFLAEKIAIYHIKTKEMHFYPLPKCIAKISKEKYQTGFVYGHSIYFIGIYSDIEVLCMNLDTEKVELCGCIPGYVAGTKSDDRIGYCTIVQHKILIPLASASAIVSYDLKTQEVLLTMLPKGYTGRLKGVFHFTESECLLLIGSKIIQWNLENGRYIEITEYPEIELDRILVAEKQLYIFGLRNQIVYIYDLESGKKGIVNCMHGEEKRGISGRVRMIPVDYGKDYLLLFSLFYNKLIFIQDGQIQKEIRLFTTDIPEIDFDEVFCQHLKTESFFTRCCLNQYLNYIITSKGKKGPAILENTGKCIYQTIVEKIDRTL